jgi:sugar lactone lactonase YvrE
LFITSYEEGKIYSVTNTGAIQEFAKVGGKAAGIALDTEGNLLVSGVGGAGEATVFQIDRQGNAKTLLTIPQGIFLNGMTHLTGDRYLIADSYKGAIWEIDVSAKTVRVLLEHERLARSIPDHFLPAINGLKIYNQTLYASNTQRQHLVRIPINPDYSLANPEIWLTNINLDDFAIDIQGNIYGATHVYNSVVKISPAGEVTTIATAEQGVAGSTAVAFGRTSSDRTAIYITTNGGMSFPLPDGVIPAKVVKLEVGVEGQ